MRVLLAIAIGMAAAAPAGMQPLPEAESFLAEARKRLTTNADLRARYAYRERRIEANLNPFGRMGSGPEEIYEVFPGPEPELVYRRLVAREGRPVPAHEIAAQDREHLRTIERHQRDRARESARDRARREARDAAEREEARALADEVLGLFDFSLVGRDTHEGHPAIIVRFVRKADAAPSSREARVAAAFAGRAWIHEHEYELMHLEGVATEDVSFGFGLLARLHEGATVSLRRRPFGGHWLPVESRFDASARALLVRRTDFQAVYEFSDYRPFDPQRLVAMLRASGGRGGL
jgi:hypothetical protein